MPDSVPMFRGQRLSAREAHLARHAYNMAVEDLSHGLSLGDAAADRFPIPKESIGQPGDIVSFMPSARMYTEREKILAERAAFEAGALRQSAKEFVRLVDVKLAAQRTFPLPKVTRPRVVADPLEWRVRWHVADDAIAGEANDSGYWYGITLQHSAFIPMATRVAAWADLLANPTEEVDAE